MSNKEPRSEAMEVVRVEMSAQYCHKIAGDRFIISVNQHFKQENPVFNVLSYVGNSSTLDQQTEAIRKSLDHFQQQFKEGVDVLGTEEEPKK